MAFPAMNYEIKPGMAYLAIPYTGKYGKDCPRHRKELSFMLANSFAGRLMSMGELIFSPISHSHPIHDFMEVNRAHSHDYWMANADRMIRHCDRMYIVPVEGWKESAGVKHEVAEARRVKMPIFFIYEAPNFSVYKEPWYETPLVQVKQLELFQ